jgi:hypothetical protein
MQITAIKSMIREMKPPVTRITTSNWLPEDEFVLVLAGEWTEYLGAT